MNKLYSGRFHKQEEYIYLSSGEKKNRDSGFTLQDYQQIREELKVSHKAIKSILERLVYSNPTEYYGLAKIVDISLEELRVKVEQKTAIEFPGTLSTEKPEPIEEEEDNTEITWQKLCHLEPRLSDLLREAKEITDNKKRKSFCKYDAFGDQFVDRLSELLGSWIDNQNSILRNMKSLEFAKETLMNALPACRNCKKHTVESTQNEQD